MKALHFVHHSFPVADGYSIRTRYIVQSQQKLGLDPVVVTRPGFLRECPRKLEFREKIDGIPHLHFTDTDYPLVRAAHRWRKATRYLERRYAVPYYRRVFSECKPCSVFHVHMQPDQLQCLLPLSRRYKVPLIFEIRGIWEDTEVACGHILPDSIRYKKRRDASTQAARDADLVITISEALRNDFVSRGISPDRITVIPNGVDTSLFVPRARDAELAARLELTDRIVFGYISSIRQLEGIDYLVKAMPAILGSIPNGVCLIVGDGDYASQLRALVDKLGLTNKVILTGRVRHKLILAYYSLIDIFVVPRTDARVNHFVTPLKPLEAMSMAKALLVSGVGGLTELVQDGQTGLVFRPEDSADLAAKATLLAQNPELRLRLGDAARRHVVSKLDWTKVIGRYPASVTACRESLASVPDAGKP